MLNHQDHVFLFASLGSKDPSTARKVHIRRLYDIFQLSVARRDFQRARRAWSILVRCKEVDWAAMWTTGLLLLGDAPQDDECSTLKLDYLRAMMLQKLEQRETILQEVILRFIHRRQYKEALNELELYLPAFPFQDNPVLHTYAGLLALYIGQPPPEQKGRHAVFHGTFDPIAIRESQSHFEHALTRDPDNVVARGFIDSVVRLLYIYMMHSKWSDRCFISYLR
ncbi:hypothetical protein FA15DRAFT_583830 [Coprinopsis marcescibilis]|uniref:Uncharacterized protein n=1 Tax=Coprinopsis marcescibilis TaxID=230819 RepID=A0A5C3L870_COPMA|nr:hypothetical protein FA15DRAFT_583830 [Coprinopsis marcescibilis]